VNHDRIHARNPDRHVDRWSVGRVGSIGRRDGPRVLTVRPPGGDPVELVVGVAVRDPFLDRLDADGGSPVGDRLGYRRRGA